ncbi:hypothetical protein EV360DRAFT_86826 [Lentinula raphanica]|nr:hypothetical protein EV360DRAFT_86826 [Lentinula raphanica]
MASSRQKVNSGSVTLADGAVLRIEDPDFVFAVDKGFQIDEVSLILIRSFLNNEGLLADPVDDPDNECIVQELVEAITPFYYLERLSLLHGKSFMNSLLSEYERKAKEHLPENISSDPKKCSRWAKQNSKEQFVILEVLFRALWGSVACDGTTVEKVLTTAYNLDLGTEQENATFLLNEEGMQLQQDKTTNWIVLTIEV